MTNEEQLRHFFARQKVPICLAITDSFMLFEELVDNCILSKAESLELKASTTIVPRAIYRCLCMIEEKETSLRPFFKILLQKHYLAKFEDLEPIMEQYLSKRYNSRSTTSASNTMLEKRFKRNKVAISFAINQRFPFLQGLQDIGMLSKYQTLTLQTDSRPVHRVVYESLCRIEKKDKPFNQFFDYVFQECFLKLYPGLKIISQQYGKELTDTAASDKLRENFHLKKVEICLAVTKKFPFLQGMHDFGFLSENELLCLQADTRHVARVIHHSLCWIEKDKIDFNDFLDFISQECLLNKYPKLKSISQFSTQSDGGNTRISGISTMELKLILKQEKTRISNAIQKTFPFMEGLRDRGILSKMESLNLQADGWNAMNTVHKTMCLIEEEKKESIREFFDYLSQDIYMEMFPRFKTLLERIIEEVKAKRTALCSSDVNKSTDLACAGSFQGDNISSTSIESSEVVAVSRQGINRTQPIHENDDIMPDCSQDSCPLMPGNGEGTTAQEHFPSCMEELIEDIPSHLHKDVSQVTCGNKKGIILKIKRKGGEIFPHKIGRRDSRKPDFYSANNFKSTMNLTTDETGSRYVSYLEEPIEDLPSQVHKDVFSVTCGNKKGKFLKSKWKGAATVDSCIQSEGIFFTVAEFEIFGGRGKSKNWKKSINCNGFTMETLIQSGIIKPGRTRKNKRTKQHLRKSSAVRRQTF